MSQYLLYSPGVQALLMWGGRQAHETVSTVAGLSVNQPRLHEAARGWHDASRAIGSVAGALAAGADQPEWTGTTAEAYARDLRGQVDRCTVLADSCRDVGDALASVAESMGQAHHALVGVTIAAGQSLATLAPGGLATMTGGGPTEVIVDSWRAVCDQLVRHCEGLFDTAAATLEATPPTLTAPGTRTAS